MLFSFYTFYLKKIFGEFLEIKLQSYLLTMLSFSFLFILKQLSNILDPNVFYIMKKSFIPCIGYILNGYV